MMTLRTLQKSLTSVPLATAWSLAELGQAMGRQELFTRQSPQRLRVLREHALIESAVSSNFRIAQLQRLCPGVSVDMIRHVLKAQRGQSKVECLGRGRNALWRRTKK